MNDHECEIITYMTKPRPRLCSATTTMSGQSNTQERSFSKPLHNTVLVVALSQQQTFKKGIFLEKCLTPDRLTQQKCAL